MKRGWQIATLCLILFSVLSLVIGVFGAPFLNARPLPLKDTLGPGPGFFPMWLSILALVLGLALMFEISRRRDPGWKAAPDADWTSDDPTPYPIPSPDVARAVAILVPVLLLACWKFPAIPLLEKIGVPEIVRSVIAFLLVAGCAAALVMLPQRHPELSDNGAVLRIMAVIGLLSIAAATLDPLGFRLTALIFTALLLPALGCKDLRIVVPFVLCASLGVFYVFYYALKVPLPIGPIDWIFHPFEIAYQFLFR